MPTLLNSIVKMARNTFADPIRRLGIGRSGHINVAGLSQSHNDAALWINPNTRVLDGGDAFIQRLPEGRIELLWQRPIREGEIVTTEWTRDDYINNGYLEVVIPQLV